MQKIFIFKEKRELKNNEKPLEYIKDKNGCFNVVNRCINSRGRPLITRDGICSYASRYVAKITFEEISDKIHVLHKCDNGMCINPDHLFLGSNADNVADKVNKNRQTRHSDLCKEDIIKIKKDIAHTSKELSEKFNVSDSTIRNIWNELTHKYIHIDRYEEIQNKRLSRVDNNRGVKRKKVDASQLSIVLDGNISMEEISQAIGISFSTIKRYRKKYKEV